MNRNLNLLTALAAGLFLAPALAPAASAQTAAAKPAPAVPPAAGTPAAPVAIPARIALINFQDVVLASNEGQVVTATTQKKYEPKKNQLDALNSEIDTLKKGITPTTPDDERARRLREIDTKEKQLNRDAEDDQTAYNAEWQEGLSKVAQKIAQTMKSYAQSNGFTIVLDLSSQGSNVLWGDTDISQAVVDAYNKASGIAPPPPPAPRPAARPAPARPSGK